MKNRAFLFLFCCLQYYSGWSQNEITENLDFERIIENLLPQQELDKDYNDVYDRLVTLYANPVDLNSVDRAGLQSLFFLSESQIIGIMEYRNKFGKFLTVYELMSIEGFDKDTIEKLIPFITITINPKESLISSLSHPDSHELFLRFQTTLEQKKGYTAPDTTSTGNLTSRYAGDPNRIYGRYLYAKAGQYSLGFTFEKDPGEQLIWDTQTKRYGLDYYSFHFMLEDKGIFKKIVVGDFTMDFGQSMIFGSGVSMGKGYEPITTVRRNNMGLRPYRSVYENKDFSGIAISAGTESVEFNAIYSNVRRDAILRSDSDGESDQYITYIQNVGLHRTPSEINSKHDLTDQTIGGNVNFKTINRKFEIGLNGLHTRYSNPIIPGIKKYNQYEFRGITNSIGGLYFNYYLRNAHVFSEMAISESKGKSIIAGIVASLSSQVQASLHLRSYDKNFHSFYGEGFGENTKTINEQGIYWGLRVLPIPNLTLATYFDFFTFPWLKYQVDAPSKGQDFMFAANYSLRQNLNFRIQYRNKKKEMNLSDEGEPLAKIEPKKIERLILDMEFLVNRHYSTKTRIQYSIADFSGTTTNGFILAQDINYSKGKIGISARFALFDTDDYDNRQFIYERDLLYVYSVPFFYDKGARFFILTKYNVSKNVSFWVKFSRTKYADRDTIGTGLEEIVGNKISNISFQARLRF